MIIYEASKFEAFQQTGNFRYRFTIERIAVDPSQYQWLIDVFNPDTGEYEVLDGAQPFVHILCATREEAETASVTYFDWWSTQNPLGPPQLQPPVDPNAEARRSHTEARSPTTPTKRAVRARG